MDLISCLTLSVSLISPLSTTTGAPYNAGIEEKVDYCSTDTFTMRNYFNNLHANQSRNHFGTCGYVAIASILTYADTFINDNIVPEQYEVHSKHDTLDGCIA